MVGRVRVLGALGVGLLAMLLGTGCAVVSGSSRIVDKDVRVGTFSALNVGSAFSVNVRVGTPARVTLHINDNVQSHVDASVSGRTLRIGVKPRTSIENATLRADVVAPSLDQIATSGAATVRVGSPLPGSSLRISASGASRVSATTGGGAVVLDLSGASRVTLRGRTDRLQVGASGASTVDASGSSTGDLVVDLSGASSVKAVATATISAKLSGASALRYRGGARFVREQSSGGSSIRSY